MNWDAIAAMAELVGAVGVIASLFYLASQIRQNTRSIRASSYHALVTNLSNLSGEIGRNSVMADIMRRGMPDIESLEPTERLQLSMTLISLFRNYENIFYQYRQNMIEEHVWNGWRSSMTRTFWAPGVQLWWQTWRVDCAPDFRDFLESSSPRSPSAPHVMDFANSPNAFDRG
jgi:hypothetical protein